MYPNTNYSELNFSQKNQSLSYKTYHTILYPFSIMGMLKLAYQILVMKIIAYSWVLSSNPGYLEWWILYCACFPQGAIRTPMPCRRVCYGNHLKCVNVIPFMSDKTYCLDKIRYFMWEKYLYQRKTQYLLNLKGT